jgi:hypothetical protein
MLRSLRDLQGYTLIAKDGDMGKIHDLFFEDDSWLVRYLVVDTGHWLPGRKVLLLPGVLENPDWAAHSLLATLTKEQVRNSPDVTADLPVSRQKELELYRHYGWPPYWVPAGTGPWTVFLPPPQSLDEPPDEERKPKGDPHLRSVKEVMGYHLQASDGSIGHVADFIADVAPWVIRYLVVDTRNWLPGRKVLIPPQWLVQDIDWAARRVDVTLTRESIRNSPSYDPNTPVNREIEEGLYHYYKRPAYWEAREVGPESNS